jgi:hypothetical protein
MLLAFDWPVYPRWSGLCRWMRDRSSQRLRLSRRGAFWAGLFATSPQMKNPRLWKPGVLLCRVSCQKYDVPKAIALPAGNLISKD